MGGLTGAGPPRLVGQPVARVEAAEKTAGGRLYTGDLTRPGMLSLAVARSLHAHARILAVHAEDALQVEGVVEVVTGAQLRRGLGSLRLGGMRRTER